MHYIHYTHILEISMEQKHAPKRAYYARCQAIYGTPEEDRDIGRIESLGFEVAQFPPQSETNAASADRNTSAL